ncbi:nuclear transport factor 2 family protein [uncultured Ilumatobacter sp.]|jgi:ketosteroid isomerase-like protein|uniref:nuclear transport factor 2 family protein n=1 Tax=uncultured Ilumatobacter sp. TaxID=879968 RepID=UPI00374FB530|tara:strand:+ start:269 stop:664 length:396 start_codon:yes stop_codon:yes gene_type:complete
MSTSADVVTSYLDAFSRGDPDEISGFVAEEFHNEHLSSIASSCVGIDEYRRRLPNFLATFVDRSYAVLELVEQGTAAHSQVVVRNDFTALYDGMPIDIPGVMWFTVEEGLITKRTDVWDSGIFVAQTATTD